MRRFKVFYFRRILYNDANESYIGDPYGETEKIVAWDEKEARTFLPFLGEYENWILISQEKRVY